MLISLFLPLAANALNSSAGVAAYNLEQCIAIAIEKHPSLKASAGAIRANESRVGQAKANYYPQLNWFTSYQRIGPNSQSTSITGSNLNPYDQ